MITKTKKTMPNLTKEQIELINKPLPAEAIKDHPTKKNMSTIKAIFVTEVDGKLEQEKFQVKKLNR